MFLKIFGLWIQYHFDRAHLNSTLPSDCTQEWSWMAHAHMWPRLLQGEPGMEPRRAHMYLFMGKKSFPNFVFVI